MLIYAVPISAQFRLCHGRHNRTIYCGLGCRRRAYRDPLQRACQLCAPRDRPVDLRQGLVEKIALANRRLDALPPDAGAAQQRRVVALPGPSDPNCVASMCLHQTPYSVALQPGVLRVLTVELYGPCHFRKIITFWAKHPATFAALHSSPMRGNRSVKVESAPLHLLNPVVVRLLVDVVSPTLVSATPHRRSIKRSATDAGRCSATSVEM